MKPLGGKAYGSIPHLDGSRRDESDKKLTPGQQAILTKKPRDKHDLIIVQEKLDGACVSVAKIDGELMAIGRKGYLCVSSPYKHMVMFQDWMSQHYLEFDSLLIDGERIVGEWLAKTHGIRYETTSPFVAFDVIRDGQRILYSEFRERLDDATFPIACPIKIGGPLAIADIPTYSRHGGEYSEGVVYRVERKGKVDFMGKWVDPRHKSGEFMEDETMWNWLP